MDGSIMDMKKKKKKKKTKVTLISSNDMIFKDLDLAVLSGCRLIKSKIEKAMNEQEEEGSCGDGDDKIITLHVPEITGKILALVLDYCRSSTNHGEEEEDLKKYKAKLATKVDDATLSHLLLAADYLGMWELVVLGGGVMYEKGRTLLEMIDIFERKLESEEEDVSRKTLADLI